MSRAIARINSASAFIPGDRQRKLVLRDINLIVDQNSHLGLAGANGAGKSTLLNLLNGSLRPCTGDIAWFYKDHWDHSAITGQEITALVSPQIQVLCQWQSWPVTVEQLIAGAKSGASLASRVNIDFELSTEIETLLEELESRDLLRLTLPELSQGQLRLVLLARALIKKPRLLLLDEWADGLDSARRKLAEQVLTRKKNEMAMLFTGHRADSFPDFVTENLFMEDGRLVPKSDFKSERRNCKPAIRAANLQADIGATVLDLNNVSVFIERKKVLHNLTWQLRQGENWRISGANGSGKSTFLRLLAGDELVAAGGRMRFYSLKDNREISRLEEKRRKIILVSDLSQACYGFNLSGLELVLSGLDNSIGLYRDFTDAELGRASELLALFFNNVEEIGHASIRRLSTGQLRKIFLARALMPEPEILLLDEPCTGLDAASRKAYLDLLRQIAIGKGNIRMPQIVLTTHAEEDVPDFINRQAYFSNGELKF